MTKRDERDEASIKIVDDIKDKVQDLLTELKRNGLEAAIVKCDEIIAGATEVKARCQAELDAMNAPKPEPL
jgi:hypothetical protein